MQFGMRPRLHDIPGGLSPLAWPLWAKMLINPEGCE